MLTIIAASFAAAHLFHPVTSAFTADAQHCDNRVQYVGRLADMVDEAEKRGQLIRHLEEALTLADEIEDGHTGFLIERALDEARSRQFRPTG
jgi:hypothetical protein